MFLFLSRKSLYFLRLTTRCVFHPGGFCPRGRLLKCINVSGENFDSHKDFSSRHLAHPMGAFQTVSVQAAESLCQVIHEADSSSYLNVLQDCYEPLPAGMSQGQHHLVKLVSIPEVQRGKLNKLRGKLLKGLLTQGFLGCHRNWVSE